MTIGTTISGTTTHSTTAGDGATDGQVASGTIGTVRSGDMVHGMLTTMVITTDGTMATTLDGQVADGDTLPTRPHSQAIVHTTLVAL